MLRTHFEPRANLCSRVNLVISHRIYKLREVHDISMAVRPFFEFAIGTLSSPTNANGDVCGKTLLFFGK